jgi:hypothetical protein
MMVRTRGRTSNGVQVGKQGSDMSYGVTVWEAMAILMMGWRSEEIKIL